MFGGFQESFTLENNNWHNKQELKIASKLPPTYQYTVKLMTKIKIQILL